MDCKKCGKEVDKKQKVFAKKDSQLCRQQTVNNYLRKQAKEANEPINNAFAEAFSKIQL